MDVYRDFCAGLCSQAGRRPVGPVKISGFPGPERVLLSVGHRVRYRFLVAWGVFVFVQCASLKIGPDWGYFCGRRKEAKILCATSYPTHETRGWCGQCGALGIRANAKQASNRGIELPAFFRIFSLFVYNIVLLI